MCVGVCLTTTELLFRKQTRVSLKFTFVVFVVFYEGIEDNEVNDVFLDLKLVDISPW